MAGSRDATPGGPTWKLRWHFDELSRQSRDQKTTRQGHTEEALQRQICPSWFRVSTRIMVCNGTRHKTNTKNLRVFWRFWVLITLTSTLNPICPVLRYPCGKQFFSTEYPSNEIYFPDKKPYSGDLQYKSTVRNCRTVGWPDGKWKKDSLLTILWLNLFELERGFVKPSIYI